MHCPGFISDRLNDRAPEPVTVKGIPFADGVVDDADNEELALAREKLLYFCQLMIYTQKAHQEDARVMNRYLGKVEDLLLQHLQTPIATSGNKVAEWCNQQMDQDNVAGMALEELEDSLAEMIDILLKETWGEGAEVEMRLGQNDELLSVEVV